MPADPPRNVDEHFNEVYARLRRLERDTLTIADPGVATEGDFEFDGVVDHGVPTDAYRSSTDTRLRTFSSFADAFANLEPTSTGHLRLYLRSTGQATEGTITIPTDVTNLYIRGRAETQWETQGGFATVTQMTALALEGHAGMLSLVLDQVAAGFATSGDWSGAECRIYDCLISAYTTSGSHFAVERWQDSWFGDITATASLRNLQSARGCRLSWASGTHAFGINVHKACEIVGCTWRGNAATLAWEWDNASRAGGGLYIHDNFANPGASVDMDITFTALNDLSVQGSVGFSNILVNGTVYKDPGGPGHDRPGGITISNNHPSGMQLVIGRGGNSGVVCKVVGNGVERGFSSTVDTSKIDVDQASVVISGNDLILEQNTAARVGIRAIASGGEVVISGNKFEATGAAFGSGNNPGGATYLIDVGNATAANRDAVVISGNLIMTFTTWQTAAGVLVHANYIAIGQRASVKRLYAAANTICAGTQAANLGAGVQTLANDYVNTTW